MQPSGHALDAANPPALDLASRSGTLSRAALRGLAELFPERLTPVRKRVALGVLYLWHDHWEAAHEIAQGDEGEPDHDLLHALAHRREGDYSNSGYWFRRAGKNEAFALLAERAAPLLRESPLAARLLPAGVWNPVAFVEAVRKNDRPDLLRALQAQELIAFHEILTR